jgi:cyclopropane-fatty-acyl-phospholipid synthase
MHARVRKLAPQLAAVPAGLSIVWPVGGRWGPVNAPVRLTLTRWSTAAALVRGRLGEVAADIVEGHARLDGPLRQVMDVLLRLLPRSPLEPSGGLPRLLRRLRSVTAHTRTRDARQVEFHYDLGDDFYALWLDPRRVYSCAYWARPDLTLGQAQEAKLDLICRKLMLRPGERFLDIGAGWGGLLVWAAERFGVEATGITLSRHQQAHVQHLIDARCLQDRVRILRCDYRDLAAAQGFDKIASVGMVEHVGRARLPAYFAQVQRLLRPGGLALNHGITAGGLENDQLGAGLGAFIERYIFPGGELVHASQMMQAAASGGLEVVDVENLRPHYARTLWAWSDALESRLPEAQACLAARHGPAAPAILRAYRLYLAGCALAFEQGWLALHQLLATRPDGRVAAGPLRGAQSTYPFQRGYMYPDTPCSTSSSPKPPVM